MMNLSFCVCQRVCVCVPWRPTGRFQQLITWSVISSKEGKRKQKEEEKDVFEWRQDGGKSAHWLISQCGIAFNAFADRATEFA